MSLHGDFTSQNVPTHILDKVVKSNKLHVDVISMGAMVGTGLDDSVAEEKGLIKNHWMWRVIIEGDKGALGQIQFGFNITAVPSVPSNQAQYARSSDRPFGSGGSAGTDYNESLGSIEGANFSDVGSIGKPPAVSSSEGHGTTDAPAASKPPTISSTGGELIEQPWGPPSPALWTLSELLAAMTSRGMEPFHFRKVGTALHGCRDGISQAAAAWIQDGFLIDPICQEPRRLHIFQLLCWRYSQPVVSGDLSASSSEEGRNAPNVTGFASSVSDIDRAVWAPGYVHVENEMLTFKQPATT